MNPKEKNTIFTIEIALDYKNKYLKSQEFFNFFYRIERKGNQVFFNVVYLRQFGALFFNRLIAMQYYYYYYL